MITQEVTGVDIRHILLPPKTRPGLKKRLPPEKKDKGIPQTPQQPENHHRFSLLVIEAPQNNGFEFETTNRTIKVKYKDPKNKKSIEEDYKCKDIIIPNTERLETLEEETSRKLKVQIAIILSDKIRELLSSNELNRYICDKKRVTLNEFIKCIRVASVRQGDFAAISAADDEIIALTAYYTVGDREVKGIKLPGLERLPVGLLIPGNKDFLPRVKVLSKHYLIDVREIKKPSDFDKFTGYDKEFRNARLTKINESFSPYNLCDFLFPGFQSSDNPIIPPWEYFRYKDKWQGEEGKELAKKAITNVLRKEGAVKDNGDIDLKVLKNKNWSETLYKEEYGLSGMMVSCPYTKNIFEAIRLAIPQAIGLEDNQIKPWEITYKNMWQTEDSEGKLLIDHVTKYLLEKHLPQKHEINLLKENGRLDATKVRELNWKLLYDEVTTSALKYSHIRFNEALKRVYPDSFGYKDDQLKNWELKWDGKWDDDAGKKRFKNALAYTFAKDGLGHLDFTIGVKAVFTKESLENKLKEGKLDLKKLLKDKRLEAGLKTTFKGNLNEAVSYVFNADSSISKTRNVISYLQSIIEHNGGRVEIILEAKYKAKDIYKITELALKGNSKEKKEATNLLLPLAKDNIPESKLAQDAIVTINESLIFDVIKKHFPFINKLDETKRDSFIQEGREAIWRSISSHDKNQGEFSTHAFWNIRGKIARLSDKETNSDRRFKPFSQLDRADKDSSIEDGIKDTQEDPQEDSYGMLHKKIEEGIRLLEKELEQLKNSATSPSKEEVLSKQITALRLRLFEDKTFDEIATVFGKPGRRECGKQPFARGLKKLLPLIGVNSDEDICNFYSTYTK